jgi:hypothetical protein
LPKIVAGRLEAKPALTIFVVANGVIAGQVTIIVILPRIVKATVGLVVVVAVLVAVVKVLQMLEPHIIITILTKMDGT